MTFQDLALDPKILKAIEDAGHTTPTPIQQQAIPAILEGKDLRASAQTGTGKTAAFMLPSLHKLTKQVPGHGPRVLILVPTRELAMQVATEAAKYSKHLSRVSTVCIYGGTPYPVQNRQLSRPYEILVATPGRLIDHMQRGRINFGRVELFILDEADRMLDMGFIEPVEQIAKALPKQRQTLMFSATLKGPVMNLSKRLLTNPTEISVAHDTAKHENIDQKLMYVDDLNHKHRLLDHILSTPDLNQAIIFTSTKRYAGELEDKLTGSGFKAAALHGDMSQRERTRTIRRLREGAINILIATDVASRGIDVQNISHVINFDLPMCAEDYVHRIGRTGRAGAKGVAFSFASSKDRDSLRRIEEFTGQKIPSHQFAGMEPTNKSASKPQSWKFGPRKRPRSR
ncbi:MAG: DEAD/DEAH box helicase [Verrucomicrobia bacterium]|nr:DEAD/DEAH box helicase [Verrucomicrobiota bacterium]MBS0637246.1 DEAD/DEAH box helicase [Verrucomicrobiota bacterium]